MSKKRTRVISFANQKGGVGKSTLCLQTAFALAEAGNKVLVVDMDTQGNTSSRLAPKTQAEDGTITYHTEQATHAADLFGDELSGPPLVVACPGGMDLIPARRNDPDMAEIETWPLEAAKNPGKHLQSIAGRYHYILIDCPPGLGRKLVGALLASTHVVVPVKVSGFAVDGVFDILGSIVALQQSMHPELKIAGVVINDMDRSVSQARAVQELKEALPELLFDARIHHRPPLDSATSEGVPIWTLTYGHVAAGEVKSVIQELIKRTA